jgi:hypothetical protein
VIVVDTSVLYPLADRRDERHAGCTGWFRGNDQVPLVPPAAVARGLLPDRQVPQACGRVRFLDSGQDAFSWTDPSG